MEITRRVNEVVKVKELILGTIVVTAVPWGFEIRCSPTIDIVSFITASAYSRAEERSKMSPECSDLKLVARYAHAPHDAVGASKRGNVPFSNESCQCWSSLSGKETVYLQSTHFAGRSQWLHLSCLAKVRVDSTKSQALGRNRKSTLQID